jgi:hypothetical protein
MNVDDRATCLEALATFAWADGAVDAQEQTRIQDFLVGTGSLSSSEIEHLMTSVHELSADLLCRIKLLPADRVCELLAVADAMCYADHAPTPRELGLIRQIGTAKFGETNASRIEGWLAHQRQANALLDELLDDAVEAEGSSSLIA